MQADYVEVWYRIWCPKCGKVNWFCSGNPNDDTRPGADVEAIECFQCHAKFWLCDPNISNHGHLLDGDVDENGKVIPPITDEELLEQYAHCELGSEKP